MTKTMDASQELRETPKPHLGRVVLHSGLRVFVAVVLIVAAVAGGYVVYTRHAEQAAQRARRQAEIAKVRDAVIALAGGHTIYAPAEWDAHQYPSVSGPRLVSWGKYGAVNVMLWQVGGRDIAASTSPTRNMLSMATPRSLCRFNAADRKVYLSFGVKVRTIRCSDVPGGHARLRVVPNDPVPGSTDVLLSVALREQGRYLNVSASDATGTIARDPVAWATGFLEDLEPFDVTGYSVGDIDRSGAGLWQQ